MADQNEPQLLAEDIGAALRAEPRTWTPNCLEPDALIELIERGGRSHRARRLLAHIGDCSYCRHEYGAIRQTLQKADTVRRTLADSSPPNRSSTIRRSWLVPTFAFAGTLATLAIIVGLVRTTLSFRSQIAALQKRADTLQALDTTHRDTNRQAQTEDLLQKTIAANAKLKSQFATLQVDRQQSGSQLATIDAILKKKLPVLAGLTGSSEHVMGAKEEEQVVPLSPRGTVVESDRPTFRWQPVSQARNYTVHVVIDDSTEKEVIRSKPVAAGKGTAPMQWTPPSSETLHRALNNHGGIYRWYVTCEQDDGTEVGPDPAAPVAKFKVMELTRLNALAVEGHRSLGLRYLLEGLLDEAEEEFRALQKADPHSAIAKPLLARVRELRGAEKSP